MHTSVAPDRRRRSEAVVFLITLALASLLTVFFDVQVLQGARFAARSEQNRLRAVAIPAPRGEILDRDGRVLATSEIVYEVSLLPGPEREERRTLQALAPFLGLDDAQIERVLERGRQQPFAPLLVTDRASYAQAAEIEEQRPAFPGVLVLERPRRHYPAGAVLGGVIGYLGEIDSLELARPEFRGAGYRAGQRIGKAGLERQYERVLAGRDGVRYVEVDARGRLVDPEPRTPRLAPVAGRPLRLALDLELQTYIDRIFPDTLAGAVVALTPGAAEVLALYSSPGYDPNDFADGLDPALWQLLTHDPARPLLHRAVAALYPPGSTWKLATAAAALHRGVAGESTRMPIPCTGGLFYAGRYARCWSSHGSLTLVEAIQHSCDVYFYQLGIRLGLAALVEEGSRMGFHRKTGIDLPAERAGAFPTDVGWYRRHFGWSPTPSEVMSLSIGQGPNAQTVLRMAHFYAALAADGRARAPRLVLDPAPADTAAALDLGLSQQQLQVLRRGLARVTEPGGTAYMSSLARWKLSGKTGTAQNPHGRDHGWFAGFAGPPDGEPEVVVVALVEHGEHGSDVAPLVAKAAEFYLDRRHGLPFDPAPTLAERLAAGRP